MILLALFTAALLLFFFLLKLQTKIDDKGIEMHYILLSKKDIKWEQIENTKVIDYSFVGGWGIRYSSKYGTVYNTKEWNKNKHYILVGLFSFMRRYKNTHYPKG